MPLANQVEDLVATVAALARTRTGRLVMLTVASPPPYTPLELSSKVQDQLRKVGLGEVDVEVRNGPGPLRVLTAEFER
jgi:hypothetical protein